MSQYLHARIDQMESAQRFSLPAPMTFCNFSSGTLAHQKSFHLDNAWLSSMIIKHFMYVYSYWHYVHDGYLLLQSIWRENTRQRNFWDSNVLPTCFHSCKERCLKGTNAERRMTKEIDGSEPEYSEEEVLFPSQFARFLLFPLISSKFWTKPKPVAWFMILEDTTAGTWSFQGLLVLNLHLFHKNLRSLTVTVAEKECKSDLKSNSLKIFEAEVVKSPMSFALSMVIYFHLHMVVNIC